MENRKKAILAGIAFSALLALAMAAIAIAGHRSDLFAVAGCLAVGGLAASLISALTS